MEYPRYKREEKLSAKLSDEDVIEINRLWNNGYSSRNLGKMFGVTQSAIIYVTRTDEQKRKIYERQEA